MEQKSNTKNTNDLRLVQMAEYAIPQMKEVMGKKWIYFGADNLYPQYLLQLYSQSSVHNALINGKVTYIKGNGLISDPVKRNLGIQSFLKSINPFESANEMLDKVALDFEINNGLAVEAVRTTGGKFNYYHVDFSTVRSDGGTGYFISNDWESEWGGTNFNPKVTHIQAFDPSNKKQTKGLIYYKQHYPGNRWYPLPTYIGSIMDIETSIEIANFHLSDIKNGFWAGVMITFFQGDPEDEEAKAKIEQKIKEKTSGSSNANGILINFANSADEAAKVEPLRHAELDKRFEQLRIDVTQSIFTGHRITSPMLFGLKSEGQLGGRDELGTAYELFKSTYARNRQQTLEMFFNRLASFNGHKETLYIEELFPVGKFIPLTESSLATNLDRIEMRTILREKMGIDIDPEKEIVAPALMDTPGETFSNMSMPEEEMLFSLFEKTGVEDNGDYLAKYPVVFAEDGEPVEPTQRDFGVLAMLFNSPGISLTAISEALKMDLSEVAKSAALLISLNFMGRNEDNYTLTDTGRKIAAKTALKMTLHVKYRYALRDDMPTTTKSGHSRKFCERILKLNRLWTRAEINREKNDMKLSDIAPDMDVWNSRGGWYKKPGEQFAVPFCRHIWEAVIISE